MQGSFVGGQPYYNDNLVATVQQVKAGIGQILLLKIINTTGAVAYLQIFDLLAANVTVGTTPAAATIPLAANEAITIPLPLPLTLGQLKGALAGISLAGTTTATGNTGASLKVFALFE